MLRAGSMCSHFGVQDRLIDFQIGSQIKPSAVGLNAFRNWRGRQGTIVGRSRDEKVWEVRWFGRPKTELIHDDFHRIV